MTVQQPPLAPAGRKTPRVHDHTLVERSLVPAGLDYSAYRPFLRKDFFYSCAYCTICEFEAQALRFTIDHYEPQNSRPDLKDHYSNLMYACSTCNEYKGDRTPPTPARDDGFRYFRPDNDLRRDHFDKNGELIVHKTDVGYFTIEALDLNRPGLQRLRGLRSRLKATDEFVAEGIMALRSFNIDSIPAAMRREALEKIKEAMLVSDELGTAIDKLLMAFARSHLLEPDAEIEDRTKARAANLKALEAMYPFGGWRAPRKKRAARRGRKV